MLEFVRSVIECLAEINANNERITFNYLEINSQVTNDVTRELNRHHRNYFNELSHRDRQRINAIVELRLNALTDLRAGVQIQYRGASPRFLEARIRSEWLLNNHVINDDVDMHLRLALRRSILDPACNRLFWAEDYLIRRQRAFSNDTVTSNIIASQLQSCRIRAPSIASHFGNLQDSVD
jgi:hypothetical protein